MRLKTVAVAVALAVTAVLPACSDDDVAADEARLNVSGVVSLTPLGGAERTVDRGRTIGFGDVVRVQEGTATVELASGDRYEIRAGHDGAESTRIEVGDPPTIVSGEVLVSDGFPAAVVVGDATVTARGPTRVDADVPAVTSFVGETQITGVPGVSSVPALRAVILDADSAPRPLRLDISDPWDRRYFDDAYQFGERLEALSRGYSADLQANAGLDAQFFATVLPELGRESEFTDDLLTPGRPAGETLVGASIVLTAQEGTFRERWTRVFDFRDQGASWGLVAADNGVSSTPVVDSIELAIGASPLSDDPPLPPPTAPPPPEVDEPDEPTPPPDTSPSTPTPPPTTVVPAPPTTDSEPDGILGEVLYPVGELLDGLLDALGLGGDDET